MAKRSFIVGSSRTAVPVALALAFGAALAAGATPGPAGSYAAHNLVS